MSTFENKETNVAESAVPNDDLKEQVFSLDEKEGEEIIILTSADKKGFDVTKKDALISKLVAITLEGDISVAEIPIPSVNGKTLKHVVEYMKLRNGLAGTIVEKPLKSKIMKEVCKDPKDAEFIDTLGQNKGELYNVILAANYMDIKCLLHLGCAKVGTMLKGQPLEKIKSILAVDDQPENPTTAVATATIPVVSSSSSDSISDPVDDSVVIHNSSS